MCIYETMCNLPEIIRFLSVSLYTLNSKHMIKHICNSIAMTSNICIKQASYKSSYEVWEPMHELHIQRLLVVTERRA